MHSPNPGFFAQIKSYPATFWVANTMEIFERMAWYGFYALSSLYITGPKETGGLGFTSVQRGQIQAIIPFFLYLFPVLTGALADRYGYRKMFTIAYVGMVLSYYLLGKATTMPTFLGAFMLVAIAAAIFKPVVVGTVARLTDESNSSTGFGIFYMMVNIGGFLGPLVAGAVRSVSWDYVFLACSGWAAVNLVIVLIFYKEPTTEAGSAGARSFRKVMENAVEVLGNLRFFLTVFVILVALMIPGFRWTWFTWTHCGVFIVAWLALNILWDLALPRDSGRADDHGGRKRSALGKRMHCSNWRFALFLLIMSGFWTSFNQIFVTMPEYIRDYTDTGRMVDLGRRAFNWIGKPHWIDLLASVEETELLVEFDRLARQARGMESMVAPEPKTDSDVVSRARELSGALWKLTKKSTLPAVDREKADALISLLAEPDGSDRETLEPSVAAAEALVNRIHRHEKTEMLATDPSLTDEDRARLAEIIGELNALGAKEALNALDLVEGARTIVQYKVRIQPTELAELLALVPTQPQEISDDQLDMAVTTINGRLELKGKPIFEDAQAELLRSTLRNLMVSGPFPTREAVAEASAKLSTEAGELKPDELALGVRDLAYRPTIWDRMDAGRQVNPEHIINFDAGAIVLLQVLVSFFMARFLRFTTMIVGMVIAGVGIGLSAWAGGTMIGPVGALLWVVIAGIVIFAVGEMMTSPTSQEYVARIAPKDKKALYMGYYFVSIALGNLFGGILSGELYQKFAREQQRPDLMWLCFGGIMMFTAVVFLLYNRFALPKAVTATSSVS